VVTSRTWCVLMSLIGVREKLVEVVTEGVLHGIAAGIGLFIAFIGLKEAGLVVLDPNTFVHVGDLASRWKPVVTAGVGFAVAAALTVRRVPGGIVIGIGTSLAVGLGVGVATWHGLAAAPPSLAPTAFHLDFTALITPTHLGLVLLFLYTDLFDTVGTLVGVSTAAGLMKQGKLPRSNRAFLSDAIGTVTGGLLGTSTVTSYIESTAGVEAGARTGLASVVTGVAFLGALFLHPLVQTVGGGYAQEITFFAGNGPVTHTLYLHPITAPALVLVGAMMARSLGDIRWKDPVEALPAFLTVAGIPLCFSISDGISLGLIAASILSAVAFRRVSWWLHGLAMVLVVRWVALILGWG